MQKTAIGGPVVSPERFGEGEFYFHHRAHSQAVERGGFVGQVGLETDAAFVGLLENRDRQRDDGRGAGERGAPAAGISHVDFDAAGPPTDRPNAGVEAEYIVRHAAGESLDHAVEAGGYDPDRRLVADADLQFGTAEPTGADVAGVGGVEALDVVDRGLPLVARESIATLVEEFGERSVRAVVGAE